MTNPLSGALYLVQGLKLLTHPKVRPVVIVPLLLNIILFTLVVAMGLHYFQDLLDWILPENMEWMAWLIWPLFLVSTSLIVFYTFSLFANLVASPFNGLLAERVEEVLTGVKKEEEGGWGKMMSELLPTILAEGKKILYFLLRAAALGLLFFIPGVNLAAPFIWMLFCSWMLAMEYLDYPLSGNGHSFDQMREKLKEKKMLSLGFGGAVMAFTTIPLVNFIAIPASVAGAAALWVGEWRKKDDPPASASVEPSKINNDQRNGGDN